MSGKNYFYSDKMYFVVDASLMVGLVILCMCVRVSMCLDYAAVYCNLNNKLVYRTVRIKFVYISLNFACVSHTGILCSR